MAAHREPLFTPATAPLVPQPQAGIAPVPPTAVPDPTPGPLPLLGRGHPVASVEIIGQPVQESGLIGSLHLAEVIRYRDGTKPDIVGYDPEGNGLVHGLDRLFVETSLGNATPEAYIAAGEARYHLAIEATPHQSLDEFVALQEHAWKMYDRSQGVPRYEFTGNHATFHNSNGALVASIREAGRGDVANRLQRDLEPRAQMLALERGPDHLSAEAAAMRLALERRLKGQPSAPGASNELTPQQVMGRATPEPGARGPSVAIDEGIAARDAARSIAIDSLSHVVEADATLARNEAGGVRDAAQLLWDRVIGERTPDLLDHAPSRDGQYFTVMRTDARGVQSLQRIHEPFVQDGKVLSADTDRITQSIGRGETFTYRTQDLLDAGRGRDGAMSLLVQAAENHELTRIKLGSRGLEVTTQSMEYSRGYEYGR